ncbi:type II secretion system minor pseudopilin GspK [Aliamphritea ceti]|uniref:type II secretion system minor pseudopilin GspK n=1 Tax=Aliamphritea ceti TaxID=1524258 RepID=UPI0021C489E8|nr:type II secretion system minor pseudopilin GspK [Aliamphritea ceti]
MKHNQQSGAALLIVLSLMAILTIIPTELYEKSRYSSNRLSSLQSLFQAQWFARSGESHALLKIRELHNLKVIEAGQLRTDYPIEKGNINIQLTPLHNCFNLNSLDSKTPEEQTETNNPDRLIAINSLKRLLQHSGIPLHTSRIFTSRLADWIDQDQQPLDSFGLERAGINTPKPNNTQLMNTAEIFRLNILGVQEFDKVKQHLCAHINDSSLTINPNDLTTEDTALLQAVLGDALSPEAIRQLLEARPADGYQDIKSFFTQGVFKDTEITPATKAAFSLKRNFFHAKIDVHYDIARIRLNSLLSINNDKGTVVARYYGAMP